MNVRMHNVLQSTHFSHLVSKVHSDPELKKMVNDDEQAN